MNDAIQSCFRVALNASETPVFPEEVPRMTEDELRAFVAGLRDDTIFTSMHVHEEDKLRHDLGRVFVPVGVGFFHQAPDSFTENIGVVWEWFDAKAKKAHKGNATGVIYPTFTSARVCHKLDWDIACNSIAAIKAETPLIIKPEI